MEQPRPNVFAESASQDDGSRSRDSLLLMATLHGAGLRLPLQVRVRNLGAGGLMAEVPDPIADDGAIEVELRGIGRVAGRIAWQTEGRIGIAFDRPVDPQRARKPVGPAREGGTVSRMKFGK